MKRIKKAIAIFISLVMFMSCLPIMSVTAATTFTISYRSENSDEGCPANKKVVADTYTNLSSVIPTWADHEFLGWEDPANLGTVHPKGDRVFVASDMTFWAVWTGETPPPQTTYTLSYDRSGASVTTFPYNKTVTAGSPDLVSTIIPVSAGKEFMGWRLFDDSERYQPGDPIVLNSDTTLYAIWDTTEFIVTFVPDNGDPSSTETITYGYIYDDIPDAPSPDKLGHYFDGWYLNLLDAQSYDFEIPITSDITLYAKWSPNPCEVTFEYRDGVTEDLVETHYYGDTLDDIYEPTSVPEGKVFAGWYNFDGDTPWEFGSGGSVIEGDVTLYAKWSADLVTVTFLVPDGSYPTIGYLYEYYDECDVYFEAEIISKPADPEISGYLFLGWFKEEGCINEWIFATDTVKKNTDLYAKFVKLYSIKFVVDSVTYEPVLDKLGIAYSYGDKQKDISGVHYLPVGTKVTEPANPPLKAGFVFAGWVVNTTTNAPWNFAVNTLNTNRTLYATWNDQPITVTLVYNNDITDDREITDTFVYGDVIPVEYEPEDPAETKVGHTFDGWWTKDGTDDGRWDDEWVLGEGGDELTVDITLYAKWKINVYDVTFDLNEGDPNVSATDDYDPQPVEHGDYATEPQYSPVKKGYTFDGWYYDLGGVNEKKWEFEEDAIKEDIELIAKWTINLYTVTLYDGDEDHFIIDWINVPYGHALYPDSYFPVKEGYVYTHWEDEDGVTFVAGGTVGEGDVKLFAKGCVKVYTVTFDLDDGEPNEEAEPDEYDVQNINYGENAREPLEPSKDGQSFEGWYYDLGGVNEKKWEFSTEEVTENITLTAKWKILKFTVTLYDGFDGSYIIGWTDVPYGHPLDAGAYFPTRTGIEYTGWRYDDAEEGPIFVTGDPLTDNVKLYATWTIEWIKKYGSLLQEDPEAGAFTLGNGQPFTREEILLGIEEFDALADIEYGPELQAYITGKIAFADNYPTVEELFNAIYYEWFKVKIGTWEEVPTDTSSYTFFSFTAISSGQRGAAFGTFECYTTTATPTLVTGNMSTGTKYRIVVTYFNDETVDFFMTPSNVNVTVTATYIPAGKTTPETYTNNKQTNSPVTFLVEITNGPVVDFIEWAVTSGTSTSGATWNRVTGSQFIEIVVGYNDSALDHDDPNSIFNKYFHFRAGINPSTVGSTIRYQVNYNEDPFEWTNEDDILNGTNLPDDPNNPGFQLSYYTGDVQLTFDRLAQVYYKLNGTEGVRNGTTSFNNNVTLTGSGTYELLYAKDQYGNTIDLKDSSSNNVIISIARALPRMSVTAGMSPETTGYTAGTGTNESVTIRMNITAPYFAENVLWQFVPYQKSGHKIDDLYVYAADTWEPADVLIDPNTKQQYVLIKLDDPTDSAFPATAFDTFMTKFATTTIGATTNIYDFTPTNLDGYFRFKADNFFGTSTIGSIRVNYNSNKVINWSNKTDIINGVGRTLMPDGVTKYPAYSSVTLKFDVPVKIVYRLDDGVTDLTYPTQSTSWLNDITLPTNGKYTLLNAYDQWGNKIFLTADGTEGGTPVEVWRESRYIRLATLTANFDEDGEVYPGGTGATNRTAKPFTILGVNNDTANTKPYYAEYQFTASGEWEELDILWSGDNWSVEIPVGGVAKFIGAFRIRVYSVSGLTYSLTSPASFNSNYDAKPPELTGGTYNAGNNGYPAYTTARTYIFDEIIARYAYHYWTVDEAVTASGQSVNPAYSTSATISFGSTASYVNGTYWLFWVEDQFGNVTEYNPPLKIKVDARATQGLQNFSQTKLEQCGVLKEATRDRIAVSSAGVVTGTINYNVIVELMLNTTANNAENVTYQYSLVDPATVVPPSAAPWQNVTGGSGNEYTITYPVIKAVEKVWFRTINTDTGKENATYRSVTVNFVVDSVAVGLIKQELVDKIQEAKGLSNPKLDIYIDYAEGVHDASTSTAADYIAATEILQGVITNPPTTLKVDQTGTTRFAYVDLKVALSFAESGDTILIIGDYVLDTNFEFDLSTLSGKTNINLVGENTRIYPSASFVVGTVNNKPHLFTVRCENGANPFNPVVSITGITFDAGNRLPYALHLWMVDATITDCIVMNGQWHGAKVGGNADVTIVSLTGQSNGWSTIDIGGTQQNNKVTLASGSALVSDDQVSLNTDDLRDRTYFVTNAGDYLEYFEYGLTKPTPTEQAVWVTADQQEALGIIAPLSLVTGYFDDEGTLSRTDDLIANGIDFSYSNNTIYISGSIEADVLDTLNDPLWGQDNVFAAFTYLNPNSAVYTKLFYNDKNYGTNFADFTSYLDTNGDFTVCINVFFDKHDGYGWVAGNAQREMHIYWTDSSETIVTPIQDYFLDTTGIIIT